MRFHYCYFVVCLVLSGCGAKQDSGAAAARSAKEAAVAQPVIADMELSASALDRLSAADEAVRRAAMAEVTAAPEKYLPPVLYALAACEFEIGDQQRAPFWFYLAQLRARSDANKCRDAAADEVVAALNWQFGGPINQHAFQDLRRLQTTVQEVLAWDRRHPRRYDARWIAPREVVESAGRASALAPRADWDAIDERTRVDYAAEFKAALAAVSALDTDGDGRLSAAEQEAAQAARDAEMREFEREIEEKLKAAHP